MMARANYRPARPRTADEIAGLPRCPDVVAAAAKRRISQVVHFTTLKGAIGILASGTVKSRHRLPKDRYLEHVYQPNSALRKDTVWLDYVNLSISRINDWMFDSSVRWHASEDNPWVVLAFDPELLGDPGVVFATTNNIYPACRRQEGLEGFESLFAEQVRGRYNVLHTRLGIPSNWPTDRQAEVLYPARVPCVYLRRIDVQQGDVVDRIHGVLGGLGLSIPVCQAPEVFE